jgi:phage repressor protein C with HTH and peptisase S24 domain
MATFVCDTPHVFHVGDVIRKMRQEKGLRVDELGEQAGVNKMTISAIERGEANFRADSLEKIATALGTTVPGLYELLLRDDQPRHTGTEPSIEAERAPDFDITSGYRIDDLPVIAEGEASPTGSIFWDSEGRLLSSITERISRPAGLNDPRAYAVKVRGDSMVPVFRPGHYVVCSPKAPVSDGDEVYLELKNGERLIKIARRIDGGWLLESANRVYEPRIVKKSEVEHIHLIVWSRRSTPGVRVVGDDGRRK